MSGLGKIFGGATQPKPVPVADVEGYWWVKKAREEIGTKEVPGSKDNPRIVEYHSYTTLKATDDETPWCSSFMCWVFGGGTRSAAARSWLSWGQHLDKFIPGCIVIYKRTGGHHVHIGIKKVAGGIQGLGGNQGNTVKESVYSADAVLGYRWPPGTPIPL